MLKRNTKCIVAAAFGAACLMTTGAFADDSSDKLHQLEHWFESANVVSGPTIVDCTLSGGSQAQCFQIEVKPEPSTYTPGPWCPTNVNDGPEVSGIWLKDGEVFDADGKFFSELSTLYNDDAWQMIDPDTGNIKVTDTEEKCEAAANPNVGPEYANFCVECLPEYLSDDATITYTIPLEAMDLNEPVDNRSAGSGLAFNGVRLDAPAPVDAITGAYTIAPFDDCGGHVNTHVGYHYHAVTRCQEEAGIKSGHATQIGIAMDGYAIMANKLSDGTKPTDLDVCNGHATDSEGYHYHAGEAGSNAILGCLVAEYGCVSQDGPGECDASESARRGPPPGGERPPRPSDKN